MLEFKHIKKLLSIHLKRSTLDVLMYGLVEHHQLYITDLDYELSLDGFDAYEGKVINIEDYKRTKNFMASIVNGYTYKDFPILLKKKEFIELPVDVFKDISTYTNYTSENYISRVYLTGVLYDFIKGEICATDGHMLKLGVLNKTKHERKFIISRKYTNLIQYIHDNIGINNIKLYDLNPVITEENLKEHYIEIQFNGGVIGFKCVFDSYPSYNFIIPDVDENKIIKMSSDNKKILSDVLKSMNVYTNKTGALCFFGNGFVACKNSSSDNVYYTEIKFNPFDLEFQYIDGEYFKHILDSIEGDSDVYCYNERKVLIRNGDNTYILMPLNYDEDCMEYIKKNMNVHIEVKVSKPKNKKMTASNILKLIRSNQEKTGKEILELIKGV